MKSNGHRLQFRGNPGDGFTIMELLAVLAVVSLILWVTADGGLARAKRTARQAEAAELAWIAESWIQTALRTRSLPSRTNWAEWMAAGSSIPLRRISRTATGTSRQLVFDPGARFGSPPTPPPFAQTTIGTPEPESSRVLLASSLSDELPDLQQFNFEALWTNLPSTRPTGWPVAWTGEPEDLILERIQLRPRFHRLVLQNTTPGASAGYSISTSNAFVTAGGTLEGWFFEGTLVSLRRTDGSIQAAEILVEDSDYLFERGRWRRGPGDGSARTNGLGALADQFLSAPAPPGVSGRDADQICTVDDTVSYMRAYANWSTAGFPTNTGATATRHPLHRTVVEAQARLRDTSSRLISP